jgi:hypothetical protein
MILRETTTYFVAAASPVPQEGQLRAKFGCESSARTANISTMLTGVLQHVVAVYGAVGIRNADQVETARRGVVNHIAENADSSPGPVGCFARRRSA